MCHIFIHFFFIKSLLFLTLKNDTNIFNNNNILIVIIIYYYNK